MKLLYTRVRISKHKWSGEMSAWLETQVETDKCGFDWDTLDPSYNYFEYIFFDPVDATAFGLIFSDSMETET